jgi:hypothetical protein
MIDNTALLAAATFLEVNGFTCNLEIRESTNYSDLAARLAPYFLLAESSAGGKRGLRPLLPVTAGGAIKTTAITAEYTFTEDTVLPGTLEINYLSLADRQPFVAQMIWRQQLESDIGIIRTAEVRYTSTAETGPYESHDLSTFCTSEDHAVKVGAYILAKRIYTTHTIRFAARPQEHNTLISAGDIIRVQLARDNTTYANSVHDYLYQVERITKTLAGDVSYEATHFPIDDQGRSLIALDVAAAVGTGIILPSGRTGVSCDVNSSSDNTIPAETFTNADGEDPINLPFPGAGSAPTGGTGNGDDGIDAGIPLAAIVTSPAGEIPRAGVGLTPPTAVCGGEGFAKLEWYRNGVLSTTIENIDGVYTVTYGADRPTFLGNINLGILLLRVGDGPTWTSKTYCKNGTVIGSSTAVADGTYLRDYAFMALTPFGWERGIYNSIGFPPYLVYDEGLGLGEVYCYNLASFGGWFVAKSGPGIVAIEAIPLG